MKRNNVWLAVVLLLASVVANAQPEKASPNKNIQRILGTWKIQKILSGKTEVAKNPTSGQWIEFRSDGRYVNKTVAMDSGSYRLNENQNVLYLESQVNSDDAKHESKKIVEWTIGFDGEAMTMQQHTKTKKSNADTMQYVYVRIDESGQDKK
ncbi:MAG: hypothetical protein ABJA70_12110 [Chryseolinea sp.]